MAEPHAHSQPIETYGLAPHNRNIWPSAHHRNVWPYNSQAAPSRLADSFVFQRPVYPLLTYLVGLLSPSCVGLSSSFASSPLVSAVAAPIQGVPGHMPWQKSLCPGCCPAL